MAAPYQILDEFDDTKGTLMDTMYDVQTSMAKLHSTVDDLLNSMAEMLKSMSEMKEAAILQQHTTEESQLTVVSTPEKQSIPEEKDPESESHYTYVKRIQIEMPIFDGSNVNLWISKAERYFESGDFTETEKMKLVYLSVDGEALNWYNFWKIRQPFVDWDDFKNRLSDRFGDFESGSVMRRLLKLKQVDSVRDYLRRFEELAARLPNRDYDLVFEDVFVNGLKDEIGDMVTLFRPKGIDDAIELARIFENTAYCRFLNPPLEPDDVDKS